MSFNAILENKILAKISVFTVLYTRLCNKINLSCGSSYGIIMFKGLVIQPLRSDVMTHHVFLCHTDVITFLTVQGKKMKKIVINLHHVSNGGM